MSADTEARRQRQLAHQRAWYSRNANQAIQAVRSYRAKNPQLKRAQDLRYWRRERKQLGKQYVVFLIRQSTGLLAAEIPDVLVEAKRAQLMLLRSVHDKEKKT